MAFDVSVAQRLRDVFAGRTEVIEKKMFGGVAFWFPEICVAVWPGKNLWLVWGPSNM